MYELALLGASLLFALQMFSNQWYQKATGSGFSHVLRFYFWTSAVGAIVPFLSQGLRLEFTWFSLLIALWSVASGILGTVCSFKALETANLSVFTTFNMLGGVLIPFAGGILIWNEELSWQKGVCCVLLVFSLLCNVQPESREQRKGPSPIWYYLACFLFNGMGALINKVHQSFPDLAVDSGSFSVWTRVYGLLLGGVVLLCQKQPLLLPLEGHREKRLAWSGLVAYGTLNLAGNWILLVALLYVDASLSYILITGGAMVFSTAISVLRKERLTRRQYASVAIAFLGLLFLLL